MIIATAPGCCALAGDPTDHFGGSVLACATQERASCTLDPSADGIILTAFGQTESVATSADLAFGGNESLNIARAVLTALEVIPDQTPAFRLTVETDIPPKAGLAGRTALLAAVAGCVLAHLELHLNPYETAELIRKIDADILGTDCGFCDYYVAVFGGLHFFDFRDKSSDRSQEPPAPFASAENLERFIEEWPFVLAYQDRELSSQFLENGLRERWRSDETVVTEGIVELARLARRSKRALLARDWEVLASFMNHTHTIQRGLFNSKEMNETLIVAALAGGASGAKPVGAEGSAVLALTTDQARTTQALQDAGGILLHDLHPCPGLTVSVEFTV